MAQVLLLHGFTGAPTSWDDVLGALAGRHEVLRPWLLGHGPKPQLPDPGLDLGRGEGYWAEVERLHTWARERGFEQGVLAGYSLGARLALGLALRYPETYRSLLVIGANPGLESESERAARRDEDEHWVQLLQNEPVEHFARAWDARTLFATQAHLGAAQRAAQHAIRCGHDALGLAAALRALGTGVMPNLRPLLQGYPGALTLLQGALDEKFVLLARQIVALVPAAQLELVPLAGHNLLLERSEQVATILARHVDSIDRAGRD